MAFLNKMLNNTARYFAALLAFTILSGCTVMAPQYQPDFELVNMLKDINLAKMQVGTFVSSDPAVDKVSIRGGSLESPYDSSYSAYLSHSLAEELKQSELWDSGANIIISGELLRNDLDASGFSIGEADLSAHFRASKDGNEV
jgi:hypothetical protein